MSRSTNHQNQYLILLECHGPAGAWREHETFMLNRRLTISDIDSLVDNARVKHSADRVVITGLFPL
jgi:hypothetical protein